MSLAVARGNALMFRVVLRNCRILQPEKSQNSLEQKFMHQTIMI
jgi:hypothetical protein